MRLVVLIVVIVASLLPLRAASAASCTFELGFAALHNLIPSTVGACKVDEHHNPKNGDGLQETTGGLLVWRKADNWTAFTDGYHTWINGPKGLQERLNTARFDWEAPSFPVPGDAQTVKVLKVTDGDTIHVSLNGTDTTLRLIGLDTPETVDPRKPVECYGPQASAEAHKLLDGQTVRVEGDVTQGKLDKYDRTLAYIWMANGTLYNYQMIRDGYAHEYTYDAPYRYQAQFKAAQQSAESAKLGFWAASTCGGNTTKPAATAGTAAPTSPSNGAVSYANCTEARKAGVTPLHRGDPGYSLSLDRDDDGIACE